MSVISAVTLLQMQAIVIDTQKLTPEKNKRTMAKPLDPLLCSIRLLNCIVAGCTQSWKDYLGKETS